MAELDAKRIINGTYGMCYLNGEEVSEVTGLKAGLSLNFQDVPIAGKLGGSKKLSGMTKNGNLNMHKVNSRMAKLISSDIKKGITSEFTIVSKLDAPDSYGAERVALYGVKFTELSLIDWTAEQNGSISQPFTFEDFEYLDMI
ncbi:MAG TPA: phage portal protein [Flavobacteriaceae bacterium]|nr:phage portal protein [Flavobacteriaceae bacterium]